MSEPLLTVYPPLETSALRAPRTATAFPFDHAHLRLTHLGRGAVWRAFHALGLGSGSRVAMPAYHCGSEVEAARLTGATVDFYRVTADLTVDEDDLERTAQGADAVYLISNFGFPPPARPSGAGRLIEDIAHGLFSCRDDEPLGRGADAAIFCPRKSLGTPDGGALVTLVAPPERPRDANAPSRPPWRRIVRSVASLAATRAAQARSAPMRAAAVATMARASKGDAAARQGSLTETVIGEWGLDVADVETAARAPSRLTRWAVSRVNPDEIRARRRRNYEALIADLAPLCPVPFRSLPPGVCPLYLPVFADDRADAIAALLEHGVRCLEVWPVPHPLLDRAAFPELERARGQLLALPVHQHLRGEHVELIRRAAVEVLRP